MMFLKNSFRPLGDLLRTRQFPSSNKYHGEISGFIRKESNASEQWVSRVIRSDYYNNKRTAVTHMSKDIEREAGKILTRKPTLIHILHGLGRKIENHYYGYVPKYKFQ
jgi:hypothetical protein